MCASLLGLVAQAQEFSGVFVLGDSLSDTGNAASAIDAAAGLGVLGEETGYASGLCAPQDPSPGGCEDLFFKKSRVSDGPVAVEYLVEGLGLEAALPSFHLVSLAAVARPLPFGSNYAVASAKARGSGPEDLAAQVSALLSDRAGGGSLPSDALYLFGVGGNDVLDALQAMAALGTDEQPAQTPLQIVGAAVDAIARNVEVLIGFGAERFLVMNVPDIGVLPAVHGSADGFERIAIRRAAALAARIFNLQLRWRLDAVQRRHPAVRVEVFDLHAAFDDVRARAGHWKENDEAACFDSETYFETGKRVFHDGCAPELDDGAPDFSGFVFWDGVHPTGRVHAEIGQGLVQAARGLSASDGDGSAFATRLLSARQSAKYGMRALAAHGKQALREGVAELEAAGDSLMARLETALQRIDARCAQRGACWCVVTHVQPLLEWAASSHPEESSR